MFLGEGDVPDFKILDSCVLQNTLGKHIFVINFWNIVAWLLGHRTQLIRIVKLVEND